MNPRHAHPRRNLPYVYNQISDLSEENIRRRESKRPPGLILVSIDDAKASKSLGGSKGRQIIWISNDLGVIIVNYGRRDYVDAGWNVDHGRCDGGGFTFPRSATVSTADRTLDSRGIVCDAIAIKI